MYLFFFNCLSFQLFLFTLFYLIDCFYLIYPNNIVFVLWWNSIRYLNEIEVLIHNIFVGWLLRWVSKLIKEYFFLHRWTIFLLWLLNFIISFLFILEEASIQFHLQQIFIIFDFLLLFWQLHSFALWNYLLLRSLLYWANVALFKFATKLDVWPGLFERTIFNFFMMVNAMLAESFTFDLLCRFLIILTKAWFESKLNIDVLWVYLL